MSSSLVPELCSSQACSLTFPLPISIETPLSARAWLNLFIYLFIFFPVFSPCVCMHITQIATLAAHAAA